MLSADLLLDLLVLVLAVAGAYFFTAGTVGLLRMPDLHCRLHAVAKADTLGLGLVLAACAVYTRSPWLAAGFAVLWAVALCVAAVAVSVLANHQPSPGATTEG